MNAHTALNFALATRGMLTIDCACPACGDNQLTRDDMATTAMWPAELLDKMQERYGAPVCFGCADSHVLCDGCDTAVADGEGTPPDHHSGYVFCEWCAS